MTVDVICTVNGGAPLSAAIADSPALLGYETSRYRPPEEFAVEFCDWPFTADGPDPEAHLAAVAREEPRYAAAPDVEGEWTLPAVLELADDLDAHAETVIVIPKECPPTDVPERFRLGRPNQPAYGSDGNWWTATHPTGRPAHLLGGAPSDQLALADHLAVASVDGANVLRYAEYGRVWTPGRQVERPDLDYYERVRESLGHLHATWNGEPDSAREQAADGADADAPGTDTCRECGAWLGAGYVCDDCDELEVVG